MPVITVEAGVLNKKQKEDLVHELTAIASKIMNVPSSAYIVLVKENEKDNIGFGGKTMTEIAEGK